MAAAGEARCNTPVEHMGLLDLAVVVSEHWRRLLWVPFLAAVLALGLTLLSGRQYESSAWLRLKETSAMVFTSFDVLAPVVDKTPWIREGASGQEHRLLALRDHLKVEYLKAEGVLVLRGYADQPAQAQALLEALVESYRSFSTPKGDELQRLQDELALNRAALQRLDRTMEGLTQSLARRDQAPAASSQAQAYGVLAEQRNDKALVVEELEARLLGLAPDAWVQRPTLPESPVPSGALKRGLVTYAVVLFLMLLVLMGRHALSALAQDPQSRAKIERIRKAFGRAGAPNP